MQSRADHEELFQELDQWSQRKDAFSVNDFLKEKGVSLDELEQVANSREQFMEIWGRAESRAWENLQDALYTKSLPRSRIAEYIKESDTFQDRDPEEVMRSLEKTQMKLELYLTAIGDTESLRKYGRLGIKIDDADALMLCGLERGMITEEQYREYMAIKEAYPDEEDEDTEDQGSRLSSTCLSCHQIPGD